LIFHNMELVLYISNEIYPIKKLTKF